MMILNQREAKILKLLSRYKFLTVSQLAKLGLAKKEQSNNYLSSVLRSMRLRRRPRIACIEFKGTYKFDKREYVYYLTKFGEDLLVSEFNHDLLKIKRPLSSNVFYDRDYYHRKMFIDAQIEIYENMESREIEIDFFHCYFDIVKRKVGKSLESKTKVTLGNKESRYVIPDGIFSTLDLHNKRSLYALELHLGQDAKRAIEQIINHVELLVSGSLSEKYDVEIGWKVIYIFDTNQVLEIVQKQFRQKIDKTFWPYFSFYLIGNVGVN